MKFSLKNKSDNYRVLSIEPFGYLFGMEKDVTFEISAIGVYDMYIGDDDNNIFLAFENYEDLEVLLFLDGKELSSGYNLKD